MQHDSFDKPHFEIFRVPISTIVSLNQVRRFEQNEHCIVGVPI